MKGNSYEILKKLLLSIKQFSTQDNNLNLPKIQKDGFDATDTLINLLLQDETTKKLFFSRQGKVLVYNRDKFIDFISNKNFLADSYTNFSNKIGLAVENRFFKQNSEVVLNFPFKDCVLEGGQTKDDKKQNELFFNETLAADEIDKLLSPKILTNAKKYTQNGISDNVKFKRDENALIKDNLIIKGNNLLALHTLKSNFAGKVKLIYIDPPYNTGNDSFNYNDNFNHSTWLTFMKNRLEVARQLLSDNGVIFVQCDDNEQAYLKVLMDEVFGRDNFVNDIIIKAKVSAGASGGGEDKKIKKNTENLIFFCKHKLNFCYKPIYRKHLIDEYIEQHKKENIGFYYTRILQNEGDKKFIKEINGIKIYKHSNFSFDTVQNKIKKEGISVMEVYKKYFDKIFMVTNAQSSIPSKVNRIINDKKCLVSYQYIPKSGKQKGIKTTKFIWNETLVVWFSDSAIKNIKEVYKKEEIGTLWNDISWGRLDLEGSVKLKSGKKPEKLLQRIIGMSTQKGDIVLDYHLGSGTTCAVAHKMGRQYIGIEQMDYIEDIAVKRMQKVIGEKINKDGELLEKVEFDNGGISKSVNWTGGGEFIYFELKNNTTEIINKITNAKTTDELLAIKNSIKDYTFVDYRINLEFLKDKNETQANSEFKDFNKLEFTEQQKILLSIFDKNQMFVNYSERDDSLFDVTDEEKAISKDFYNNTHTNL